MIFTCCECEHHYEDGVTGDADERTCDKCRDFDRGYYDSFDWFWYKEKNKGETDDD